MELEVGNIFEVDFDTGDAKSEVFATFERLYGDFTLNDAYSLRVGKFQTPVGRWNLVPAEPFVWTATQPVLLDSFDEHQTGAMAFGTFFPGRGELSYWLYGQFIEPFDVEADEEPADYSVGGRLEYTRLVSSWSIGSSFLAASEGGSWSYLGGLDGQVELGPFEGTMELVYRDGGIEEGLWDIYLQAVYEIVPTLYFVSRYEHSDPLGSTPPVNIGDVGLTWIPEQYLIFKATYRFADHPVEGDPAGFKATFSALF